MSNITKCRVGWKWDETGEMHIVSFSTSGNVLFLILDGGHMNVYHSTLYAFSYVSTQLSKFEPQRALIIMTELSKLMVCASGCITKRLCVSQFINHF